MVSCFGALVLIGPLCVWCASHWRHCLSPNVSWEWAKRRREGKVKISTGFCLHSYLNNSDSLSWSFSSSFVSHKITCHCSSTSFCSFWLSSTHLRGGSGGGGFQRTYFSNKQSGALRGRKPTGLNGKESRPPLTSAENNCLERWSVYQKVKAAVFKLHF